MNWQGYVRMIAIVANALFVLFLFGSRGWWISVGLNIPLIVYPTLALLALAVNGSRPRV